ncbi:hypothetical protein BGZ98_009171, partial [Dissophora globulifera]
MDSVKDFLASMPPEVEPSLAITACDSYEGCILASKLADHLAQTASSSKKQLVCMARNIDKCGRLKKMQNIKLVHVDYDDPNSIAIAIRGIQTVILVPEIEPQRVEWADRMVDIMAQEGVIRCILISSIGTDAPEKEQLKRFVQTEDKVKGTIQRWTIL